MLFVTSPSETYVHDCQLVEKIVQGSQERLCKNTTREEHLEVL
jgi:hypothetical protein